MDKEGNDADRAYRKQVALLYRPKQKVVTRSSLSKQEENNGGIRIIHSRTKDAIWLAIIIIIICMVVGGGCMSSVT